ncbi:MAG: SHOCT domain-containing protein [Phycisphaeraceae bacterium]|nr:SHOCT domain-containing protein [Phycisphaeraceae bacterium]MBX3407408.1 SHOCT domain-containing protein [Phycisphaeraceae bacterium]
MPSPLPPPGAATSTSTDVVIWVGVLIVAVLLLGALILLVRKRMLAKDKHGADNWIGDLRQMHKRGELSTEEYESARRALTAKFAANTGSNAATPTPRPTRPPAPRAATSELRAKPGFDLTGAPLPTNPAVPPAAPGSPPHPHPPQPPTPPGPYDRKPPP